MQTGEYTHEICRFHRRPFGRRPCHGHWLGAAALGAAIAIGLWAGLKGRKEAQDAEPEEAADEDAQEA